LIAELGLYFAFSNPSRPRPGCRRCTRSRRRLPHRRRPADRVSDQVRLAINLKTAKARDREGAGPRRSAAAARPRRAGIAEPLSAWWS